MPSRGRPEGCAKFEVAPASKVSRYVGNQWKRKNSENRRGCGILPVVMLRGCDDLVQTMQSTPIKASPMPQL
eukprot:15152609-Alexandrium_andersonii.AAC.1